jgi:hypothetical protein
MHLLRKGLMMLLSGLVLLFVTTPAAAQWSDDAALNTLIADKSGEQLQPKIVAHPDGGAYISWLDNTSGGYDVFLQRIDDEGNLLWDEAGVLVAARQFSSTEDYGLSVDTEGNALLAFRDDRQGGLNATAQRVDEAGNLLWGETGTDITTGADFVGAPDITGLSDENSIAAFTSDTGTRLVKLNPDGELLWQQTQSGDNLLALSDLRASDAADESGSFIALFRFLGPPTVPGLLFTQKYDADGTALWNNGALLELMNTGTLQLGYFPKMVTDGSGGMAVGWYTNGPLEAYVQHVDADGGLRFGGGGQPVSNRPERARVTPVVQYDGATDDIYAFWSESNTQQTQFGAGGQRFDADGNPLWGTEGITFKPLGSRTYGDFRLDMQPDGLVLAFSEEVGFGNSFFYATKLDTDAEPVWEAGEVQLTSTPAGRFRLSSLPLSQQQLAYVWEDDRSGAAGIYAQNLNADGSLGIPEEEPDPVQEVVFSVDMSVQQLNGNFLPETGDEIMLRGAFNDWGAEGETVMTVENDDIYTLSLEIEGEPGSTLEYKYYIEAGDGRTLPNDGWEGEVGPGENGNRVLTLTEDETQQLPVVFFNNDEEHDTAAETPEQPRKVALHQNYPNPFNPVTSITYELPESGAVQLRVFNIQGQEVARLVNERQPAGQHQISFDASSLASGVYLYRLETNGIALSRKMTLIK